MDTRHKDTHTHTNTHRPAWPAKCTHTDTHKHINVITWVMYRAHFRIIHMGHLSGTFKDFLCVISDNNS